MADYYPLITDLALILVAAALMTLLFKKLKQPLVLGYITAGLLIGPHFKWLPTVIDSENIHIWAEIGIIFLLFSLGLEFSFKKLFRVGGPATITAIVEVISMLIIGYAVGQYLGWSHMDSLFLGGMLSMSSTTIIIKAFEDLGLKAQKFTGIVFGALVVEDIVAILMMVLLSTLAVSKQFAGLEMVENIISLVFFLALWFLLGIYLIPTFLKKVKDIMNEETLLIVSLGLCLGMVVVAEKAGFSAALGAFIMGSILAETVEAEKIENIVKPVKILFGAVFFVSVGMIVDPAVVVEYAFPIFVVTLATIFGKLIFSSFGVLLSGQPLKVSIESGFSLAQIGEFAFIIAGLGLSLGVTSDFLYPVVVSVSVITTFLTPYTIRMADPVYRAIESVLPEKIKRMLENYGSGTQTANRTSDWKKFIKENALAVAVYSVILSAIVVVSYVFLTPFITKELGHELGIWLSAAATLIVMAPFLNGLISSKLNTKTFKSLWIDKKFNRGPLVSIIIIRMFIAGMFIFYVLSYFFTAGTGLIVLFTVIAVSVIYLSRRLQSQYTKIEKRFFSNFNARDNNIKERVVSKKEMQDKLMERDIHFGTFCVAPESVCVGKKLSELKLRDDYGVNIVSIGRGMNRINIPDGNETIYPLDRLLVLGTDAQMTKFQKEIERQNIVSDSKDASKEVVLQHIVIENESPLLGKSIRESDIRQHMNCLVVGIEQKDSYELVTNINHKLIKGDVLWIVGEKESLKMLLKNEK